MSRHYALDVVVHEYCKMRLGTLIECAFSKGCIVPIPVCYQMTGH